MNPCIRTGADVYITSHGTVLHGDLYKLAGVYVLRYCLNQPFNDDPKAIKKCFARFEDASAECDGSLFGEPRFINFDTSQYGTLIIREDYVECIV